MDNRLRVVWRKDRLVVTPGKTKDVEFSTESGRERRQGLSDHIKTSKILLK